ncbi:MAG: hypothetical protein CM1200mP20_06630 [Pseudomonadota bacterium]|nr:MAG: hypothetical protein CM1200mP20_06630 [Pseudomonadota bacterium]
MPDFCAVICLSVFPEQFMTETAKVADIVLPATMFLEHDDVYQGGGHQHILLGPRLLSPLVSADQITMSSVNWQTL